MTHVTCRLTAKNRDQLRNPSLGNRVWASFLSFIITVTSQDRGAAVFSKLAGPIYWSGVLLPFSRIFLERYTQFGTVCYTHQTPTKKLRKKLGVRANSGGPDHPTPPAVVAPTSQGTLYKCSFEPSSVWSPVAFFALISVRL